MESSGLDNNNCCFLYYFPFPVKPNFVQYIAAKEKSTFRLHVHFHAALEWWLNFYVNSQK